MARLFANGWPAFITADQEVKKYIVRVREQFADLELVLLDRDDAILATGWAVPVTWDGQPATLPSGYTGSMISAVEGHGRGETPNTLVIMGAQIRPDLRRQGLAADLLTGLRDLAERRGWPRVLAPVRPTLKSRYPLTPIDRFATWTREDGLSLDPWVRTHQRLGARVIALAPRSQVMTGSVGEWESWTDMTFPDSGQYVIPDGLNTLEIDREADRGLYVEPNIWMQHK